MAEDDCCGVVVTDSVEPELAERLSAVDPSPCAGTPLRSESPTPMSECESCARAMPDVPALACLDRDTQQRLRAILSGAGITACPHVPSSPGDARLLVPAESDLDVSTALPSSGCLTAVSQYVAAVAQGVDPHSLALADSCPGTLDDSESLLSLACSAGYVELAQVLLAMHTNVEDRGAKGDCTPLMEAASAGHLEIVDLLLKYGADPNATSTSGNSPLMYACAAGHEAIVQALLRAGADVELRNENGHCPLMEAASAGHVNIARCLVAAGASGTHTTAQTEFKVGLESPLTLASYKGHLDMVRFLLASGPAASDRVEELHTALMEASMDGHLEVARALLEFGAPVNLASDSFESPLTLAACGGHVDLVSLLLDRGALVEEPNDEGYTALMEASREGHEDVVELLLDHGASVNSQTEETGETALTLAACGGFRDVLELLVSRGGDLDLGANTPLMEAAQEGHLDAVRYLIQETLSQPDLSIDATTATNDTALSYAAENGHVDVCAVLLDAGAVIDHEADGGRTPLMKATKAGHFAAVQYLLTRGAEVNKVSQGNEATALSLACSSGHLEIVQLLLQNGANPGIKLKDGSTCIIEAAKGGHTPIVEHLLDWNGRSTLASLAGNNESETRLSCAVEEMRKRGGEAEMPPPTDFEMDPASLRAAALSHRDDLLMVQAHAALVKQAGEKLSSSEVAQLSELLRSQFRNVFPSVAGCAELVSTMPDIAARAQASGNEVANARENVGPLITGAKRKASGTPVTKTEQKLISERLAKTVLARPPALSAGKSVDEMESPSIEKFQPPPPPTGKKPTEGMTVAKPKKVNAATQAGDVATTPVQRSQSVGDTTSTGVDASASVDLDNETESNHDTALTLACTGGHDELVDLLLHRGADIEHRDKKGFTPVILAATAGHVGVVEALLNHGANIEAQSERTKDTALSLACSGGRKEVVDLLLKRGANKEHRNVSDYTPLSLAASGGYVEIVMALLNVGAEINSRTGSKLGISPLMLAAMNGHVLATRVLLERGSDINAQIETNRNTALTLACFQGRHEVVKLLLDYHASVEHRAKTGLTPLMEAANGGYVEVGRLLLECEADPNASPVPTSRDTALTIAADKGHHKFVELLVHHGAQIDARNKKGCTPLWLACNGGHVEAVQTLVKHMADLDAQDNRRVSPLMVAFRKGHLKVVKYLVKHVQQFPSDQECYRYIATISDKDLLNKCRQCMEVIVAAKDRQAAEANKAAESLLEMLAKEEAQAITKKLSKQRQKEKKKAKRQAKKNPQREGDGDDGSKERGEEDGRRASTTSSPSPPPVVQEAVRESAPVESEDEMETVQMAKSSMKPVEQAESIPLDPPEARVPTVLVANESTTNVPIVVTQVSPTVNGKQRRQNRRSRQEANKPAGAMTASSSSGAGASRASKPSSTSMDSEWYKAGLSKRARPGNSVQAKTGKDATRSGGDDWREVDSRDNRRRSNRLSVSSASIARVIGRGGVNINAIREATGAHIEVEKQQTKKEQMERMITIRGAPEAIRCAVAMINGLIAEIDAPVAEIIARILRQTATGKEVGKATANAMTKCGVVNETRKSASASGEGPQVKTAIATSTSGVSAGIATLPVSENCTSTTTPNVWQQRAAMRQMQKVLEEKQKMELSSSTRIGVVTRTPEKSPSHRLDQTMGVAAVAHPVSGTIGENERKAPGYARPASGSASHPSPTVSTASGRNDAAGQAVNKSGFTTPSHVFSTRSDEDSSSSSLPNGIDALTFSPIGLPIRTGNANGARPSSAALPSLPPLSIDAFPSGSTRGGTSPTPAAPRSPLTTTTSTPHVMADALWGHSTTSLSNGTASDMIATWSKGLAAIVPPSPAGDQLGLLHNLAQLRVTNVGALPDWSESMFSPQLGSSFATSSGGNGLPSWLPPNMPPPSTAPLQRSANSGMQHESNWINQIAAQLAGQQGTNVGAFQHSFAGASQMGGPPPPPFHHMQSDMDQYGVLSSLLQQSSAEAMHQQQARSAGTTSHGQQGSSRLCQMFGAPPPTTPVLPSAGPPPGFPPTAGVFAPLRAMSVESATQPPNTAVPPPVLPPFFNAQMPPPSQTSNAFLSHSIFPSNWSQPPPLTQNQSGAKLPIQSTTTAQAWASGNWN